MKKSLIRGLFLLSCLFFFSSVQMSAQTFRDASDIQSDIPSLLTTLETDYQNLDTNSPTYSSDVQLIKLKTMSLVMINQELSNYSPDFLLMAALVKNADLGLSAEDYDVRNFSTTEQSELFAYLEALVVE